MTKTLLMGYYGMQNSGDDALLCATAMGAKQYLGARDFIINAPRELSVPAVGHFNALLAEPQRVPGSNRFRQYGAAYRSNRVIFGGGSVFHSRRDLDLNRDLLSLVGGTGHLALGVGIGPFDSVAAERSCAKLLQRLSFVGVRDAASKEIADAIAPTAHVEQTFDLAPSLLQHPHFHLPSRRRHGIGVCLCPKERLQGDPGTEQVRLKQIARALDMAHFYSGEPVYFQNFNGHPQWGDAAVHREVAAMMDSRVPVRFVDYDPNPFNVLQQMAGYRVVLSMRLHGSIFAYMTETPVLSLNYHPKCEGWCEQAGVPSHLRFDCATLQADSLTDELCEGLDEGFELARLPVAQAVNASIKNWSSDYVVTHTNHFRGYSAV
ncbi:polysaccharide pyruvyl transferase family protein [Ketobacter sp.]|uniref:polysaccharide pyruvyl transferase family protein n=1 Tax=Ketobacter sp. TaxID=2083498 RepID=UPI000F16C48B|nr:polysaccharide pyruvyl transferase family protein [Ketobacter sp.]RLT96778.1 MAG: polysaccharide pyruvyl transferase family protein [Ketobacter sp.]